MINTYLKNYTGLPSLCWLGILMIFIDAVAGGVCFFLSIYFVNNLGFNIKIAGLLISAYGLGTVVGSIIGGKLSDDLSPNLVAKASLILQGIAFLLLMTLHTTETLVINLFVMGGSAYIFKTAINCWVLNQPGNSSDLKLKLLNLARVASNLGLAVSGSIIGIFDRDNFSNLFLLSSLTFFIFSIIFILKDKKKLFQINDVKNQEDPIYTSNTHKKILLIVLTFVFLIGFMIAQLGTTYPIYIQNSFRDLGMRAVSILFILDTVLIVLFQAPLVNFLKKSNKIFFIGIGGLFMGGGMAILNISFIFSLAIISCVIWTTGEMLFIPLTQLVCYEKGLDQKQGKPIGIYQAIYATGTICGPALGAFIYQR
ncbi:MAG TPA: MFS transporter, partial [Gammaproteobacteria bacterium]|nr:MFS transporter [Gammaproteobacteria bacterium]